MKVLITGGAGFIGSHLCDFLIQQGHQVIGLDNLITGAVDNISHLLDNKGFSFIKHDITKPIEIAGRIDYVLHFASPASPRDYMKLPIQTLRAGALGTHNALGIAKTKRAKFVLASTSEIYGDPLVLPQKESYWGHVNPIGPRSCYDEAKRFAEAITMAYYRVHKLDVRIARIFNTYGPRMRCEDGRVIPNFISQGLSGKSLTIYGKGKQTRSFCYISDLVEGIYKLMLVKDSRLEGERVFNLGNPVEFTILELAELIGAIIGRRIPLVYRTLPQDDPKQRKPDISRAVRLLNWKPKVELKDGLIRTIEWFRCCGTKI